MAKSPTEPVPKYELDRLAEKLTEYQRLSLEDNKEIKQLLKDLVAEIKSDYVSNDKLKIALSDYEPIRKFFWWVASGVGVLMLATIYQLVINGVQTL